MFLREKYKDNLVRIFSSIDLPIEVWAYGSRVNGKAHEGSDLDLVIRTSDLSPMPLVIFNDLYYKIKNSNIPILADLFDWARLPASFHHNIKKEHKVLYTTLAEKDTHTTM